MIQPEAQLAVASILSLLIVHSQALLVAIVCAIVDRDSACHCLARLHCQLCVTGRNDRHIIDDHDRNCAGSRISISISDCDIQVMGNLILPFPFMFLGRVNQCIGVVQCPGGRIIDCRQVPFICRDLHRITMFIQNRSSIRENRDTFNDNAVHTIRSCDLHGICGLGEVRSTKICFVYRQNTVACTRLCIVVGMHWLHRNARFQCTRIVRPHRNPMVHAFIVIITTDGRIEILLRLLAPGKADIQTVQTVNAVHEGSRIIDIEAAVALGRGRRTCGRHEIGIP